MTCNHVRVGVGVLVKDCSANNNNNKPNSSNKVFCGIRKGSSHGSGCLALPGGHLELYEEWSDCAKREVEEEMGISIYNVEFCHVTNDIMTNEGKHYVTIFCTAECKLTPKNMEPHKCEGWTSYSWQELKDIHSKNPNKLFGPLAKLIQEEPPSVLDFLS
jgi:8-oxo-dGTP diphosphatase